MASKNNKGKIKKPLGTTLGKGTNQEDDIDLSHIQKPIHTSVFGLKEVFELFKNATSEIKNYITYECDIMYECRTCRTIFRSLANFILHKRSYCLERFNPVQTLHQDDILENVKEDNCINTDDESNNKLVKKKTLDDVMNMLSEKQKKEVEVKVDIKEDVNTIVLEKIEENSTAVFQTSFKVNKNVTDLMKSEVMEIHSILDNDEAVLDANGKVCKFPLNKNLRCSECGMNFSTKKTLDSHINYKHNKNQIVFLCPVCKDTFANAWSVYRHLYKVHRKTATQIRRLREQIHNSCIRKEEKPIKKEEQQLFDKAESQWLNSVDGEIDVQMCEKCGKKFGRKAALQSHTQMCLKKSATCNTNTRRKESEKSIKTNSSEEIDNEIKKEGVVEKSEENDPKLAVEEDLCDLNANNKVLETERPTELNSVSGSVSDSDDGSQKSLSLRRKNKLASLDTESMLKIIGIGTENETNTLEINQTDLDCDNKRYQKHVPLILRRNSSLLSKESVETNNSSDEQPSTSSANSVIGSTDDLDEQDEQDNDADNDNDNDASSTPEKPLKRKSPSPDYVQDKIPKIEYIDFIDEYTHNNFVPKMKPYVDTNEVMCIPCQEKHNTLKSLWLHMSKHFSWYRFQCSHCSYISFYKSDCMNHIKEHQLDNDNSESAQILPIPCWKIATMAHEFQANEEKVYINEDCDEEKDTDLLENVEVIETDPLKVETKEEKPKRVKKKLKQKVITSNRPVRNRQVNRKYTQGDFLYDLGVLKLKEANKNVKKPKKKNICRPIKSQKEKPTDLSLDDLEEPPSPIQPTVVEENYDSEEDSEEKTYSILMPMEFYPEAESSQQ